MGTHNSFRLTLTAILLSITLGVNAEEVTVTWTAATQGFGNGSSIDGSEVTVDEKTSIRFAKNDGSTSPAYYTSGNAIRLYAGNSMTVSGSGISKIVLTFATGDKDNEVRTDCGEYSADGIWTGRSDTVTFNIIGSSGHRRIESITISYGTGDSPVNPDPPIEIPTVYSIQEFKLLEEGKVACLYLADEMNARVIYKSDSEVYLRDKTGAICLTLDDTLYNPLPAHNQHVAGYMTGRYETDHGLPLFVAMDSTLTEYMLFADQVSEPDTKPESIDVEEYGAYYADWVTLSDMHVSYDDTIVTLDNDDHYFTVNNRFGLGEDDLYSTPADGSTINITGIAMPYDEEEQIAPIYIDPYLPVEVVAQPPKPVLRGDVNLDGKVDISDVVAVINIMAGTPSNYNGDVNEDGKTDISDVVSIINIMAMGDGAAETEGVSPRMEIIKEIIRSVEPAGAPDDFNFKSMTIYFVNGMTLTLTIDQIESITYIQDIGMKIHLAGTGVCLDFLYSQMIKIEYVYEQEVPEDNNVNANWKEFDLSSSVSGNLRYAYRLEYPHLNSNQYNAKSNPGGNQIVVKSTDDYGITYALEWDNGLIANRWTCYTLHNGNLYSNVGRKDAFKADNEVANSSQLGDYSGSSYSRGHLCPSADRLCSREQNSQTFFLTNMQPQWQTHNGGLWARLETKVRDWGESKWIDTLYVVKAATIGDVTLDGVTQDGVYSFKCNDRLPVPKYFYMALLAYHKATDEYEALGLWTIHQNANDSNTRYGDYAITIDELERRTGIDFFCNLPDDIENKVESDPIDYEFWGISNPNYTKPREAEYEGDMSLEILPTE